MQERYIFREMLSEIKELADQKGNVLTLDKVKEFFKNAHLTDEQLITLRDYLEGNYKIEGDLRREIDADIRRKIQIHCYQGQRHRKGLPVRGQRTKTNARTRKGPKRTVAGKKKATK